MIIVYIMATRPFDDVTCVFVWVFLALEHGPKFFSMTYIRLCHKLHNHNNVFRARARSLNL
jgi:hypothetical protein